MAFRNDPIAWWRDVCVGHLPRLYITWRSTFWGLPHLQPERKEKMITPLRDRLKHSLLPKPSAFDLGARARSVYTNHLSSSTCLTTRTGEMWFTGCQVTLAREKVWGSSSRTSNGYQTWNNAHRRKGGKGAKHIYIHAHGPSLGPQHPMCHPQQACAQASCHPQRTRTLTENRLKNLSSWSLSGRLEICGCNSRMIGNCDISPRLTIYYWSMSINHRSIDQARWSIVDWSVNPLIDRWLIDEALKFIDRSMAIPASHSHLQKHQDPAGPLRDLLLYG